MERLNAVPAISIPNKLAAIPHPWQLTGTARLQYLCTDPPFKGGICGDQMGLGKSLTAIIAIELARNEVAHFISLYAQRRVVSNGRGR
ncbi:hypothetical protein BJX62DRAFT_193174 [Aspergillus germanicus]